jgi:fermentation-respiration switch protein FrsA (DUF1100 family)
MSRVAIGGGLVAVTLLAVYWLLLFLTQRSILFPVPPLSGAPPRPSYAEQVWLKTSFGRTEAWYLPAIQSAESPAPLLVFSHGNGELIDHWPDECEEPRRWGVGVLLVEYPGYGRSDGTPTEKSITESMLAAYDWARQHADVDRSRIIPYGRSLGGGAAAGLSLRRPVPVLILESSFSTVAAFASGFGAPAFLVRDKFDSVAALRSFNGPTLILHGDRDDVVPPHHARALAAASSRATLTFMPCGHNDCPRPWAVVRSFLDEHGITRTPPDISGPVRPPR